MDIINAIREIEYRYGLDVLLDSFRCNALLADLAPESERERRRISLAFSCGAMKQIGSAFHDAGASTAYFTEAERLLIAEADMNETAAKETVACFRRAFGFPGYREMNPALVGKITEPMDDAEFVFEGEIKDGKPHGICTRTMYYNGKFAEKDESVWLYGAMNGYCKNSELFMETTMIYTEYFVVNDTIYGVETTIDENGLGERTEYKNGKRFDLWQSELK